MKKLSWTMILVIVSLAACASPSPSPADAPSTPTERPVTSQSQIGFLASTGVVASAQAVPLHESRMSFAVSGPG